MAALDALLAVLLFCSIFGTSIAEEKPHHTCKNMLHSLAVSQMNYVECSTLNAVPVQLCMNCSIKYDTMQEAYKNLTTNCSREYFDHDRINVIQTTQNMLLGLWKKAYCDDCFNKNNSEIFGEKLGELNLCFDINHKDEDKCIKCIAQYTDLNNFYISLDLHNNGQICYDLQDSMNQTRVKWSKQFNCCHRQFHMTLFLVATISIGSLPIIFYASAYILTKRRERNHAVLNIAEDLHENGQIPEPQIIEPTPNVSEQPPRAANLIENIQQQANEDTGSDNDDEHMPQMKKIT